MLGFERERLTISCANSKMRLLNPNFGLTMNLKNALLRLTMLVNIFAFTVLPSSKASAISTAIPNGPFHYQPSAETLRAVARIVPVIQGYSLPIVLVAGTLGAAVGSEGVVVVIAGVIAATFYEIMDPRIFVRGFRTKELFFAAGAGIVFRTLGAKLLDILAR